MNWLCYELINAFSYRLDEYWMSGKMDQANGE